MSRNAANLAKCLRHLNRRTCETSDFSDQTSYGGKVSFRNGDATSRR